MKKIGYILLTLLLVLSGSVRFCQEPVRAAKKAIVVVIDPGHGGTDSGALRIEDGKTVAMEKELNLKIAKALKKELETYQGVKVYLTRKTDQTLTLTERVRFAVSKKADVLISIHNNAKGDAQNYTDGSSVLTSAGQYRKPLATASKKLGKQILKELHKSMLTENRGILLRKSSRLKYPNGTYADYYGLIRQATEENLMSMIVEHAFVDEDWDYECVLSSDETLAETGIADATAIARYYGLSK